MFEKRIDSLILRHRPTYSKQYQIPNVVNICKVSWIGSLNSNTFECYTEQHGLTLKCQVSLHPCIVHLPVLKMNQNEKKRFKLEEVRNLLTLSTTQLHLHTAVYTPNPAACCVTGVLVGHLTARRNPSCFIAARRFGRFSVDFFMQSSYVYQQMSSWET